MKMRVWLRSKIPHIVFLGLLCVYLVSANQLYVRFLLKNGKPLDRSIQLPTPTENLTVGLYAFNPLSYDGEPLYDLNGYAFNTAKPETDQYTIKIVLHSTSRDIVFPASIFTSHPTIKALAPVKEDLSNSFFRVLISPKVLPINNYRIGVLLEKKDGSTSLYMLTGYYIERSPNKLRFIEPDAN
jgi:hypothetical protein